MLSYYYHHSKYPVSTGSSTLINSSSSSSPTSHISVATIKNFSSNLSSNSETDSPTMPNNSEQFKQSLNTSETNTCKCKSIFKVDSIIFIPIIWLAGLN